MSYTAYSIRDSIRIRIVTPDSIRIRFERKMPIHRSLYLTLFEMADVRHLGLVGRCCDHPRRPLGVLYCCAKFGCNRCNSIDNMGLSIFCQFGSKTSIHAPKTGGFGGFHPLKWVAMSAKPPKGTSLHESASF